MAERVLNIVVWLFVAGQIAFAESFPNRPTVAEMDEKAALGTECINGVNERSQATQYQSDPAAYGVAPPFIRTDPAIGWYLDSNTMAIVDNTTKALMPYYVDLNTVSNGSPNFSMLTVAGVWANLRIGDGTSKFTQTPAWTDANGVFWPATYGEWPWRIYQTNLQERYNVLQAQKKTTAPVTQYWSEVWQGMGRGHTYKEARDAAVADYGPRTSGYYRIPVRQSTKAVLWSNFVYQGGCGPTGELPNVGYCETTNIYWYSSDLTLTMSNNIQTNIIVASSNIGVLITTNIIATNIIVTGELVPDATGTYIENPWDEGRYWYNGPVWSIQWRPAPYISEIYQWGEPLWMKSGESPEGVYDPLPLGGATGTAYAVYSNVIEVVTNPASPVDYSGTYWNKTNYWQSNGNYLNTTNPIANYVIYSDLTLDTNAAYLAKYNEPITGVYVAVNMVADTEVSYRITNSPNPSGAYVGECVRQDSYDPDEQAGWTSGTWRVFRWTNDVWYITEDTEYSDSEPSPSWSKSGNVEGTYDTINGTGVHGIVYVDKDTYDVCSEEIGAPVYYTNVYFYQCWLTKVKCRISLNTAGEELIPDVSGTYVEGVPSGYSRFWIKGAAMIEWNSLSDWSMISIGMNMWEKWGGASPEGVYPPSGGGASGTAYVVYNIVGSLTNLIVLSPSPSVLDTNIEHQVDYWAYSEKPAYGTLTNIYHKQGLGLYENAWKKEASTAWTFDKDFPIDFGDPVDTVPVDIPDPGLLDANVNQSITIGFTDDFKAIVNWRFLYCK